MNIMYSSHFKYMILFRLNTIKVELTKSTYAINLRLLFLSCYLFYQLMS